ncbi:alpha/beta fold hydrolase [Thermobifida halotolerans]|uniref:alpha/beta fold hydrolase n=1 Tax=Thermobifida halotolerans TaxID=483545 RepID=UPI003513705E
MAGLTGLFRVVRYDIRGHGDSPAPPGPYSIADLASDVLRLLDRLKVERAHFAGLSIGGMTGMWLGAHAPERIDRLALLCTSPKLGTPESWADRIRVVREQGTGALAPTVVGRWFTPGLHRTRARHHRVVHRHDQ